MPAALEPAGARRQAPPHDSNGWISAAVVAVAVRCAPPVTRMPGTAVVVRISRRAVLAATVLAAAVHTTLTIRTGTARTWSTRSGTPGSRAARMLTTRLTTRILAATVNAAGGRKRRAARRRVRIRRPIVGAIPGAG